MVELGGGPQEVLAFVSVGDDSSVPAKYQWEASFGDEAATVEVVAGKRDLIAHLVSEDLASLLPATVGRPIGPPLKMDRRPRKPTAPEEVRLLPVRTIALDQDRSRKDGYEAFVHVGFAPHRRAPETFEIEVPADPRGLDGTRRTHTWGRDKSDLRAEIHDFVDQEDARIVGLWDVLNRDALIVRLHADDRETYGRLLRMVNDRSSARRTITNTILPPDVEPDEDPASLPEEDPRLERRDATHAVFLMETRGDRGALADQLEDRLDSLDNDPQVWPVLASDDILGLAEAAPSSIGRVCWSLVRGDVVPGDRSYGGTASVNDVTFRLLEELAMEEEAQSHDYGGRQAMLFLDLAHDTEEGDLLADLQAEAKTVSGIRLTDAFTPIDQPRLFLGLRFDAISPLGTLVAKRLADRPEIEVDRLLIQRAGGMDEDELFGKWSEYKLSVAYVLYHHEAESLRVDRLWDEIEGLREAGRDVDMRRGLRAFFGLETGELSGGGEVSLAREDDDELLLEYRDPPRRICRGVPRAEIPGVPEPGE